MKARSFLYPGLMIAVNRQRLADIFELAATRYETLSRNVFVAVHFANASPDLKGEKLCKDEVLDLAKKIGDRVVQYLAAQRDFLKPAGESPSPSQRQVEKGHSDWIFNVRTHAKESPLHPPPVSYLSTPQVEQDVVGLFNQYAALRIFPGIRIYATSQIQTYDCLVEYDSPIDGPGIAYKSLNENPLGLAPFVLGTAKKYSTKELTVEFKNNLDGLIYDLDSDSP